MLTARLSEFLLASTLDSPAQPRFLFQLNKFFLSINLSLGEATDALVSEFKTTSLTAQKAC